MIRFVLGLFILFGAVGADDYAIEAGIQGPPIMQTVLLSLLGLSLMAWALPKLSQMYDDQ